jgi:hypothetical protein
VVEVPQADRGVGLSLTTETSASDGGEFITPSEGAAIATVGAIDDRVSKDAVVKKRAMEVVSIQKAATVKAAANKVAAYRATANRNAVDKVTTDNTAIENVVAT